MSEHDTWSTIRVAMLEIREVTDALEGIAAMLASRDDVGGVETRDPSCIAEGPDFVAVERPELLIYTTPSSRDAVEQAARELVAAHELAAAFDVADHHGDDWRDAWKRHYRPLRFGANQPGRTQLLVRPSWIPRTSDDPALELVLDPGRAFGTGLHESTRLCLHALVELADVPGFAPKRVLDLGCGSGILGLAAARLWPDLDRLLLADHDIEAVETTRENTELNELLDELGDRIETQQLELGGDRPLPMQQASLIVANIRPSVLIPAAPAIIEALASDGRLILSGILDEEGDEVLAAYATLELLSRPREADWCALVLRKRAG